MLDRRVLFSLIASFGVLVGGLALAKNCLLIYNPEKYHRQLRTAPRAQTFPGPYAIVAAASWWRIAVTTGTSASGQPAD